MSSRIHTHVADHFVQFYETRAGLVDSLAGFVAEGLGADEACVLFATEANRAALEARLGEDGAAARAEGRYVALDAEATLARFMRNGSPRPERFREVVEEAVGRVAAGGRRVRAFGEMVALLRAGGDHGAAIELEALWNQLVATRPLVLFCAYPLEDFGRPEDDAALAEVCAAHARVVPAESYAALSDEECRARAVVELQRKAAVLEAEIAERARVEDELRAAKEQLERLLASERAARLEAEEASRLKDEFLANVSHELRTPLNSILGWTGILSARDADEATLRRAIATIDRNARAQVRVVDDVLDVSQIITGRLRLDAGEVDLHSVVREAADSVRAAAVAKRIRLDLRLDDAGWRVAGDARRLRQVAWNLLSNGVKFTPPGGRVEVRLERAGSDALLRVSDTGPGIDPEVLPYVFDRFRQGDGTTTRAYGGLGLGLSIVRHLVELHGGTVRAESDGPGRGATFTARLPLAADPGGSNRAS